ncbi:hypothetical protein [Sporosarcina sp. Marseille-Q4943]|uniref:hypothetical protein n=1 Tax=Sporosarcina sp. Marseille-Q4943 TaxID=2942204 RepID=UPI00208DC527|nr:hypothetical protein [Sporosarcina sp. Marseille-Q4943]
MEAHERVSVVVGSALLPVNEYLNKLYKILNKDCIPFYFIRLFNSQVVIRLIFSKLHKAKVEEVINKLNLDTYEKVRPYQINYLRYGNEDIYQRIEEYNTFILNHSCERQLNSEQIGHFLFLVNELLISSNIEKYNLKIFLQEILPVWENYYGIIHEEIILLEGKISNIVSEKEIVWISNDRLIFLNLIDSIREELRNHPDILLDEIPHFTKECRDFINSQTLIVQNEMKLLMTMLHMTANMFGIHHYLEVYCYLRVYRKWEEHDYLHPG